MNKVESLLKLLESKKIVTREEVNKLVGSTNTSSLIMSLRKKGYSIDVHYDGIDIKSYTLTGYKKPFYIIMRDISRNYPEFEKRIRIEYKKVTGEIPDDSVQAEEGSFIDKLKKAIMK